MKEKETSKLYHSISNINSQFIEEAQSKVNSLRLNWWNVHKIAACLTAAVLAAVLSFGTAFAASAEFRHTVISFLFPIYTENELHEIDEGHRTGSFSMEDTLFTFLEKFNNEDMADGITVKKENGFEYSILPRDGNFADVIVECNAPNDKLLVMMEKSVYEETAGLWQVVAYQIIDSETAGAMIAGKG